MPKKKAAKDHPLWDDNKDLENILGEERLDRIYDEWHREVTHNLTCKLGRTLPKNFDDLTPQTART
eukprot:4866673-Heterocapsa_arctica.AAC.1